MTRKISGLLLISYFFAVLPVTGDSGDAFATYKQANYKAAIPLLKAAIEADGKNPLLHAALLSSLTYEGMVAEASDEADADESAFPQSADVLAARGEFAYYMADMAAAQTLFRAATKLKEGSARGAFGLARMYRAASYHRTARQFFLKAHDLDPDDALITKSWMRYMPPEKQGDFAKAFVSAHPWLFRNYELDADTRLRMKNALGKSKPFELEGTPSEVNLHLIDLLDGPTRYRGPGLEVTINGGHKLSLLVDTGASGILLTQKTIDKIGLNHLGGIEAYGIGDDGTKQGFMSLAESCQIGSLKFKNCVFNALEGKRIGRDASFDGLIGPDVFDDYLINFDFQRHSLRLTPMYKRAEVPQGYDREIPADEKDFSPMFRLGDHLLVTTKMNEQSSGLFLLDTGSSRSFVDSTFAGLSEKLHRDDSMRVRGISGEVKKVFEVDKATLQFSHFRQTNLGMTVFDLNNGPDHPEFRMSGILGLPVLARFHLTIDYRNGLVKFEPAIP